MGKQSSSGRSKVLILSIGLGIIAILAVAAIWTTQFMRSDTNVPKASMSKRIKIAQIPAATRMKITQPPPPVAQPQSDADPIQLQPPGTPSIVASAVEPSLSEETPQQPSTDSHSADPRSPTVQADPPGGEDTSVTINKAATEMPLSPPKTETNTASNETHEAPLSTEISTPMSSAVDAPADNTLDREDAVKVAPPESRSADAAVSVSPETTTTQSSTEDNTETVLYNLQLGAFRVEAYAHEAVAKISKKGYSAFIFEIIDARQNTWYTVRIGRYKTREEAKSSLDRFKLKENLDAVIARSGKL